MNARFVVYGMVIPSALGIAAMAAVVLLRGGHELTWLRFIAGCAALVTAQITGACIGSCLLVRRSS